MIPAKYSLTETKSKNCLVRTETNVVDSDATLVFTNGDLEGGSLRTVEFARKHKKQWLHVDLSRLDRQQAVDAVVDWLKTKCPAECVLNVAGSRESKAPGIYGLVKARMIDVISKTNGTLFYPIADDDSPSDIEGEDTRTDAQRDALEQLRRKFLRGQGVAEVPAPQHHPKTLAEAVQIVLVTMQPETKERIRAASDREEFITGSHFGMAMWIRNNLIHQNQNRIDLYADFQKGSREGKWAGSAEPDAVSGVICGLVWDALQSV